MSLVLGRSVYYIETLSESSEQSRDFLGRVLEVVVHCDDGRIPGFPNPTQKGIVLAVVAHEANATHPPITGNEVLYDFPASVSTAIINEDEFAEFVSQNVTEALS
jgi:hypothetical protein